MRVFKKSGSALNNAKIHIGDVPIGVFTGSFAFEDAERDRMIEACCNIWKHLRTECHADLDPIGLHRFDLVPGFARSCGSVEDVGELFIKGIYEVNGHSPECLAAASMIRHYYPDIPCINAAEHVARSITAQYGDVPIAFVVGRGSALKNSWYKYLLRDLSEAGLDITAMTPEEVMYHKPSHVWRWGDARIDGENDYAAHHGFTRWLYAQDECVVFNGVLESHEDITNKRLLLSSSMPSVAALLGDNRVLDENAIHWSTEEHEYQGLMAKPDGGSHGKGLIFGEHYSLRRWREKLENIIAEGLPYSLWQTQWLPAISVGQERLAIDLNPAFWIDGDRMEYLYTIIRIVHYDKYRTVRKINVSQGGGIAGLIY